MTKKPLIFDFLECRQEEFVPPAYVYDHNEQMNIIYSDGAKIPFIDVELKSIELLTKTKVRQEGDDDRAAMEMATKTRVKSETDDHHHSSYLELKTKTFVKVESDDEKNNAYN